MGGEGDDGEEGHEEDPEEERGARGARTRESLVRGNGHRRGCPRDPFCEPQKVGFRN